jgi:lysyl-tRNA synthetase class 2
MSTSERELFLSQHWKPYPILPSVMPGSQFLCSRISQIHADYMVLMQGQTLIAISEHTQLLPSRKQTFGAAAIGAILQSGDWIAVDGNEIWLLAPQLKEFRLATHAPPRELLQEFSEFLQTVRLHFKKAGFLEAHTPGLVDCPGTEPYLDAFSTEFVMGQARRPVFLPTSPELHLKKMLSLGYGPLFEIKTCFRNGEISSVHEPEFHMLEWYRPFAELSKIANDVEELLRAVSGAQDLSLQTFSMAELFEKFFGFQLRPTTSQEEFASLAKKKGIETHPTDSIDDVFHRLFMEGIETKLPAGPVLVNDYPPFLAAYARLNEDGWADRFEIYWKGVELANAFHEINDPNLQQQRMQQDLQKKTQAGRAPVPLDEEFLQALQSGMPPSAGIALGLDRLFMLGKGLEKIQDFKVFPYQRFL